MDFSSLLDEVVALSRVAGRRIHDIYGTDFAVVQKSDNSPLTDADLAAHRILCAGLAELTDNIPILSEESADEVDYEQRRRWQRYWLVDPLDGTKEFVKRNGEFTVNIALIDDHAPILGVVHVPVTDVTYFAARGAGAFRKNADDEPQAISVSKSARVPVVVGSRSHPGESLDGWRKCLGEHNMIAMGSSLKFCMVAEGGADVYPRLGPTSEWDTAAAQAIVECAGGCVIDLSGEPLRYNARASLLNPHFIVIGDNRRDWLAGLSNQ